MPYGRHNTLSFISGNGPAISWTLPPALVVRDNMVCTSFICVRPSSEHHNKRNEQHVRHLEL
jgi:hypothetical protein